MPKFNFTRNEVTKRIDDIEKALNKVFEKDKEALAKIEKYFDEYRLY